MAVAVRGGGHVDLRNDGGGPIEHGLSTGPFGFGQPGVVEEGDLCGGGMVGSGSAVLGVMGGLGAAGRVAHPDHRLGRVGGAGQLEAQGFPRVGEPAVVGDADVEGLGLGSQEALDSPVVDDGDRPGVVVGQGPVDGLEAGQQISCPFP